MHCGSWTVHWGLCTMSVRRVPCTEDHAQCPVHHRLHMMHQDCALCTGDRAQCIGTACRAPGALRATHRPCTGHEALGTLGFGDQDVTLPAEADGDRALVPVRRPPLPVPAPLTAPGLRIMHLFMLCSPAPLPALGSWQGSVPRSVPIAAAGHVHHRRPHAVPRSVIPTSPRGVGTHCHCIPIHCDKVGHLHRWCHCVGLSCPYSHEWDPSPSLHPPHLPTTTAALSGVDLSLRAAAIFTGSVCSAFPLLSVCAGAAAAPGCSTTNGTPMGWECWEQPGPLMSP